MSWIDLNYIQSWLRLSSLILYKLYSDDSCTSDVFSLVKSLAKWLFLQSNEVGQVTGWERMDILVNSFNGEVRGWKSDESLWWSVANWWVRQAGSSKFKNSSVGHVNFLNSSKKYEDYFLWNFGICIEKSKQKNFDLVQKFKFEKYKVFLLHKLENSIYSVPS